MHVPSRLTADVGHHFRLAVAVDPNYSIAAYVDAVARDKVERLAGGGVICAVRCRHESAESGVNV